MTTPVKLAARLDALLLRWGNLAVIGLGAVVVLFGLGGTGLWEPWEMDRAALARNLTLPAEVVTAIAPGNAALADKVTAAAAAVGGVARAPDASVGVEGAIVRAALDRARGRVVGAIVMDRALVLSDVARPEAVRAAGRTVSEALRYAGLGTVVILSDGPPDATELATQLLGEKWRDFWETTAPGWGLTSLPTPEQLSTALTAAAAADPDRERLVVLAPSDEAGLTEALARGVGAIGSRALFKDHGELQTTAPLDTWLRALSYRALGTNEFATRLPGALLALMALWVLIQTVRRLSGARAALMAGVVLVTMPLFFGQARIASGESGLMLALTLVGCGLLLRVRTAPGRDVPTAAEQGRRDVIGAAYLGAGLLVGVLADGLFALVLFTVLSGTVALVSGARTVREWAPTLLFGAALVAVVLMVDGATPGSFASQLALKRTMFSTGPTAYFRNFDLIIHELGFGLIPWSPIAVIAVGAIGFSALQNRDGRGLVVAAWFFVPVALLMVTLKNQNHFVFAAAPAAALAVGMLGDVVVKRPMRSFWIAAAALMMFYILRHEVKESAEPMVAFLTYDPPFSKDGNLRFPADLRIGSAYRGVMLVMALAMLAYFGRYGSFVLRVSQFFARKRPFVIALSAVAVLASLYLLVATGSPHNTAMGASYAAAVGPGEERFIYALLSDGALLPIGILVCVVLAGATVYVALRARLRLGVLRPTQRLSRVAWAAALGIWGALALTMWLSTTTPEGYWQEVLTATPSLAGYVVALGVAALVGWVTRDRVQAGLAAAAIVAYLLGLRLDRDAHFGGALVTLGFGFGACSALVALFAYVTASAERLIASAAIALSLLMLAFVVPLADRWTMLSVLINQGGEADPGTFFLADLVAVAFVGIAVWLVANRLLRAQVDQRLASPTTPLVEKVLITLFFPNELHVRLSLFLERGRNAVWAIGGSGVLCAVIFTMPFQKNLAVHVSQKHIIEAWFQAEPDANAKARIFKHGSFGGQSDRDTNYYTAEFPEIRDRQAALKTLLGAEDLVVPVDTVSGSEWRALPGWSALNDADNDRKRDLPAVSGSVSAVSATGIVDAKATWPVGALVGKRLVDVNGRAWPITGNDATSVTVDASTPLTFATTPPTRAYYVIDAADSAQPRASAAAPERRALLIPTDDLSELNYAFRQISSGRHLPILDGSSYRVLLAVSELGPTETQQNRFALATYTDDAFAKITDKSLRRVWGNFEDTIQVVGYKTDKNVTKINGTIKLTVYFKALKPVRKSLEIFLHADREGGGSRLHGDHWPLNPTKRSESNKTCIGCFRTDHWLPGDIVEDTFELEVPEDSTTGSYMFYLGLYQPGPDTRLKVVSWDTKNCKHDGQNRLGIGTFTVR